VRIYFVDKKSVDERGEKELRPTPPSTHTITIPHTQHNATKRDIVKNHIPQHYIYFPHSHYKKTLPLYKKQRVISAFIARKN
jgi:hypothetical protein